MSDQTNQPNTEPLITESELENGPPTAATVPIRDLQACANALTESESQRDSLQKLIAEQRAEISELRAQLEQERIQHAGCLTAAEGWALSDGPKKGEWAWSPAFQAVLELRAKLEAANARMEFSNNFGGKTLHEAIQAAREAEKQ